MSDSAGASRHDYPAGYPYAPQAAAGRGATARVAHPPAYQPAWLGEAVALFVLVGCGLLNLLVPQLFHGSRPAQITITLVGIYWGVVASQLALPAAWLVWSERGFALRLGFYWIAQYFLLVLLLVGFALSGDPGTATVMRATLGGLPLVALAVQLPLWGLKIYAGWRIERAGENAKGQPRQISIGDMLVGTMLVAAAVGAARLAIDEQQLRGELAWLAWAILVPSLAAISLLSLPPAIFLLLRSGSPGWGLLKLVAYATLAVAVTINVIALVNAASPPPWSFIFALMVMPCAYATFLAGALLVVRQGNYRLVIRR